MTLQKKIRMMFKNICCREKCSNCKYWDSGYCDYYAQNMSANDSCNNWS